MFRAQQHAGDYGETVRWYGRFPARSNQEGTARQSLLASQTVADSPTCGNSAIYQQLAHSRRAGDSPSYGSLPLY